MMALSIGLVVMFAALKLLDTATRQNARVQKRATSIQQSRFALDEVVRRLRSQTCIQPNDTTLLPPVEAASATSVRFYADFSDGSSTTLPERHTLTVGTDGRLTDAINKGTGTRTTLAFSGTTTTRAVADGVIGTTTAPIFQYYGFDTSTPPTATQPLNSLSSPTVATADLPKIARIVVTLAANGEGTPDRKLATTMQDEVFVRLADPDDAAPTPKCA
jgi:Tfp pilus assembly protein PilW